MKKYVLRFKSEKRPDLPSSYSFCVCVLLVIHYICCSRISYAAWELSSEGQVFDRMCIFYDPRWIYVQCCLFFFFFTFLRGVKIKSLQKLTAYMFENLFLLFDVTSFILPFHLHKTHITDWKSLLSCSLGTYVTIEISVTLEISDLSF